MAMEMKENFFKKYNVYIQIREKLRWTSIKQNFCFGELLLPHSLRNIFFLKLYEKSSGLQLTRSFWHAAYHATGIAQKII